MLRIIADRSLQHGRVIVPIQLNSPYRDTQCALPTSGMMDTGMSVGDGGRRVGLVLPWSLRDNFTGWLVADCDIVSLRMGDGSTQSALPYHFEVQLIGDGGVVWPDVPINTRAVFFSERTDGVLIGFGLWNQWRTDIDGPAERFSIWVP